MERILAKMDSFREMMENMDSRLDANLKKIIVEMRVWRKEMTACQEATEACLESKEPTSVEIGSESLHEDVPKDEASVKTVRALKKRNGD
jgi:hypothetical protein